MRNILFWSIIVLLTLCGCAREQLEKEPSSPNDGRSLTVSMSREKRPASKALLLDSPGLRMDSRWAEGDRLGVWGETSGENVLYEVTADNIEYSGRTAVFVTGGKVPEGSLTAYYPYSEGVSRDRDGVLHMTLPASQAFTRTRNVPAPDGSNFVMVGKGSKQSGIELKNVLSLLKVGYVAPENQVITKVLLTDLGGGAMSGDLSVSWEGDEPLGVVSGGSPTVTMDIPDGVLATGEDLTVFWFVAPARAYPKGLGVTFVLKDGTGIDRTYGKAYGKTLERNTVYPIGDAFAPQSFSGDEVQWEYKDPSKILIVDGGKTDLIKTMRKYDTSWPSVSGDGSAFLPTLSMTVHQDFGGHVGDYVFFNEPSEILPEGFVGQIMEYETYGKEADVIIKALEDISEPFSKLRLGSPVYAADGSVIEGGGLDLGSASLLESIETPDGQDLPFDVEGDTLTLYQPATKAVTNSTYTSPRLKLKTVSPKLASGDDGPGEMTAGVQLQLKTRFSMGADEDGNTEYFHFNVNPRVLLTFNVKFSATKEFDSLDGFIEFGTFKFAPMQVGPFLLRPAVEIGAYCGASASVELNVSYKYIANWGNYGFSYQRGQGFAVRSSVAQPEEDDGFNMPEVALAGSFGMSVGLYATPQVSLYGMITGKLQSRFGLNFAVGYEVKQDGDGFSNGTYFSITPEFSLQPSVTTLGGVWTQKWEAWQPLDFDPIWQKYLIPEMKVSYFSAEPEKSKLLYKLEFHTDSGIKEFHFHKIYKYKQLKYSFTLRKETLFNLGVGFAVYTSDHFDYNHISGSSGPLWIQYGLEDYIHMGDAIMRTGARFQQCVLLDTYNSPDPGEDSKTIEGTLDLPDANSGFDIENGTYYMLVPCVFLKGATTAPMAHYDYARVDDKYSWRLPVVCHWPLLSNGNEWPSGIEYYFVEGEDGKPGHWEKTIPD